MYFYFFVYMCWVRVLVCVLELTSDHDCDLVPAGPDAVLDLADKSGVDSIVHLQHLQHVLIDLHRVGLLS